MFKTSKQKDLKRVAEKQLKKNLSVIESLRDYDVGKKHISTRAARERLPNIRVTA